MLIAEQYSLRKIGRSSLIRSNLCQVLAILSKALDDKVIELALMNWAIYTRE